MEIRPPGFLVRGWSQELNGSARCSGDALIAPTTAQTTASAHELQVSHQASTPFHVTRDACTDACQRTTITQL
eukprot:scaffold40731_cov67-Phaeocystis_antarctica.AAC.5